MHTLARAHIAAPKLSWYVVPIATVISGSLYKQVSAVACSVAPLCLSVAAAAPLMRQTTKRLWVSRYYSLKIDGVLCYFANEVRVGASAPSA